jgi:transcriptional regulator with PAS, ATPase and Fis domain
MPRHPRRTPHLAGGPNNIVPGPGSLAASSTDHMNMKARIIGEAPSFAAVLRAAEVVAATDVTVLLLGESGTGKDLLAQHIHDESPRMAQPFIALNCAAIPEALVESELFGHRRGAFTGAVSDNAGHLRTAHGGTLFLDEIAELPPGSQAKLLRFLESGECQSVGHTATRRVDTRIIAATNRDLYSEVKQGRFRADLYYRLNIVPLELPPLRERAEDVARLAHAMIVEASRRHGLTSPKLSKAALSHLARYSWPGNVRELRNFCERIVVLLPGQLIEVENLPRELREREQPAAQGYVLPDGGIRLDDLEADIIRQAIGKAGGNRSKAARLLGITRDTLLYRIQKYAIQA